LEGEAGRAAHLRRQGFEVSTGRQVSRFDLLKKNQFLRSDDDKS
jgi:hypothetical protein